MFRNVLMSVIFTVFSISSVSVFAASNNTVSAKPCRCPTIKSCAIGGRLSKRDRREQVTTAWSSSAQETISTSCVTLACRN